MPETQYPGLNGNIQWFYKNIHRLEPILDKEQFTIEAVKDNPQTRGLLAKLCDLGALDAERTNEIGEDADYQNLYTWDQELRRHLNEYSQDVDGFRCGHREHIKHHPEKDCFTCKYCEDNPEISRERIEEVSL